MKTKSFYHLPLSSLQWLLTGLLLGAIPLWFQVPPALIVGFFGCLVWRFILEKKGLKCPKLWLRFLVGLIGVLLILRLHGTIIGLTPGMGLLLLLIALKVLEMRTEREFMLLGYLAFFILLTSLFFSQTLLACLYVCIVFIILTATIVQFTGGASEGFRLGSLLRYTTMLVVQTLPLIILLFIFLPRMKGGALLQLSKPKAAQSGMSDQINPGSVAELTESEEDAFRVDFPNGETLSYNDLYWRVAVFTDCHGLIWRNSKREKENMGRPILTGPLIDQRISMEPHTGGWVYALDRPLFSNGPVYMTTGNVLTMNLPINERMNIRVTSQIGNDRTPISSRMKTSLTQVPENLSPRTRLLVDSWTKQAKEPRELMKLALNMFRKENFRYTLTPGTYSSDGLDEFLFERKLGFCEHYAAAFATLMRLAGIPSRMVAGYHGGEINPFSNYLIVRQADAHAWVEIWVGEEGWIRVDPVDYINPLRVDSNTPLASRFPVEMVNGSSGLSNSNGPAVVQKFLDGFRLGWDAVNFQWNLHIVSYDQASQRDFYQRLGIRNLLSWKLAAILLGGLLVVLSVVYFLVKPSPAKKDQTLILYHDFCRVLARYGLPRGPNEGPKAFRQRAIQYFPEHSAKLTELFNRFIALRYGKDGIERQVQVSLREIKRILRVRNHVVWKKFSANR